MEKKGMINFLKVRELVLCLCSVYLITLVQTDERFGSYADYVCLKGEAERAKQLHENEVYTYLNSKIVTHTSGRGEAKEQPG